MGKLKHGSSAEVKSRRVDYLANRQAVYATGKQFSTNVHQKDILQVLANKSNRLFAAASTHQRSLPILPPAFLLPSGPGLSLQPIIGYKLHS